MSQRRSTPWVVTARTLARFVAPYRSLIAAGAAASLALVGLRLVLPWLFKVLIAAWMSGGSDASQTWPDLLAVPAAMLIVFCAIGVADNLNRLVSARLSIRAVDDLRRAALAAALRRPKARAGDIVSRLVADASRTKAALKGFFVHVGANLLLLFGVAAVLLVMSPVLGALMTAAFAVIAVHTAHCAARVYRKTRRSRKREGKLAARICAAVESHTEAGDTAGRAPSRATSTALQGRATTVAYAALGIAFALSLLYGSYAVSAGQMPAEHMVGFLLYARMTRSPIAKLARQGARAGKLLGTASRMVELLSDDDRTISAPRALTSSPPASLAS